MINRVYDTTSDLKIAICFKAKVWCVNDNHNFVSLNRGVSQIFELLTCHLMG